RQGKDEGKPRFDRELDCRYEVGPVSTLFPASVLVTPVKLRGKDGRRYTIKSLGRDYSSRWAETLAGLHNIIPYVRWTPRDLLAEFSSDGRAYHYKWELSLRAEYRKKPVGILLAHV